MYLALTLLPPSQHIGGKLNFVSGGQSNKTIHLKYSTATFLFRNCVVLTLDNPQTSMSTVFTGSISSIKSSSSENWWQQGLWIIQSSRDTARVAVGCFKCYFSALWVLKTNFIHFLCFEVVTGISPGKMDISKPGQTTRESEKVLFLFVVLFGIYI